jgi:hypothetical protein
VPFTRRPRRSARPAWAPITRHRRQPQQPRYRPG